MAIYRKKFHFPVRLAPGKQQELAFPPEELPKDGDDSLKWPAEVFQYATISGNVQPEKTLAVMPPRYTWSASLGHWANPKQPATKDGGLPDYMLRVDPNLKEN